jgi:hypothetical protein
VFFGGAAVRIKEKIRPKPSQALERSISIVYKNLSLAYRHGKETETTRTIGAAARRWSGGGSTAGSFVR